MNKFVVAALALSSVLIAQDRNGPFLGMPAHMLVGPNTSGPGGLLDTGELYLKRAGIDNALVPGVPFPAGQPDFSMPAMFPGVALGFRLGSFSTGFHRVFVDWSSGDPVMPGSLGDAWAFLSFSVTADTAGEPGSRIASEVLASGSAGGAMFTYVLPGSNLPAGIEDCFDLDVVQLASDSAGLGLQGPAPELRDFDPFTTFYESDVGSLMPANPWIYFTLPQDVIDTHLYDGWFVPGLPSSATVLGKQWTGTMWGAPVSVATYLQLGLEIDDEIDALAVDEDLGDMLLSLRRSATTTLDEQLMAARAAFGVGGSIAAAPYLMPTSFTVGPTSTEKVVVRLDVDDDGDIDSVCLGDPNKLIQGAPLLTAFFPYAHGCRDGVSWPSTMISSVWVLPGTTTTHVAASVSGLVSTPGPGLIGFLLYGVPLSSPWTPLPTGTAPLDTFVDVLGWNYAIAFSDTGRVEMNWPVPPPGGTTYIDFQWLMFDASGIYQSNVVCCRF